jgi:hypothetical protein
VPDLRIRTEGAGSPVPDLRIRTEGFYIDSEYDDKVKNWRKGKVGQAVLASLNR